ncbi:molybdopterin converting factor [Thioalkalivibrio denitrificans]|uniref:Molybdopterin synthase catalytic subunit n=1 Tax=Thioalkalivibrio denitrificans TaxID=108003 RepID=A0A1V3NLN4_9GAMM|nr:molybdenum cofactor biosynthesis protein MoaE [Thioalkalivibrio denitrificans]OOG25975.1 molybdopterin converting factor [Thioalkalivibrio denitrificans]
MSVSLHPKPFDPWTLVATHQAGVAAGRFGATAVFVGTMRDFNEGDDVRAMTLEHYPGMTEKHLEAIVAQARERWTLEDCLIAHRVGAIEPGEPIVVTAVWSAHRREAFEACRFLMEELKHRAPFWKREALADGGTRWVEKNTEG